MWVVLCGAGHGRSTRGSPAVPEEPVLTRHVTNSWNERRRGYAYATSSKKRCLWAGMFRDGIQMLQHSIIGGEGNTHVEGDDDAGRVVLGQLDGRAEEAVEVVVRRDEPGTCANEQQDSTSLSETRPYERRKQRMEEDDSWRHPRML